MRLPHRAFTALSARFAMTKSGVPDESGNYERCHDPEESHYKIKGLPLASDGAYSGPQAVSL
jgi:hypothetical protein